MIALNDTLYMYVPVLPKISHFDHASAVPHNGTAVRTVKVAFKMADVRSLDSVVRMGHIITTTPGLLMSILAPGRNSLASVISPYPGRDMLLR